MIEKRDSAPKVWINDILHSNYIKNDNALNYIEINNQKISRVNILATLVMKNIEGMSYGSIVLEDGSGQISVRSFETQNIFDNYSIEDLLLVIGKPREYGNERYVIAEIIKKIEDKRWIKVRKLELMNAYPQLKKLNTIVTENSIPQIPISTRIFKIIEEIDNGTGADIDEVISRVNAQDADKIISELIKEGVVFEVTAGRIRMV